MKLDQVTVVLEHASVKLPVRVLIVSTCSGAWPVIVDADAEGDAEDIISFNTAYVVKERYRRKAHNYNDHPKSFKLTKEGKAILELADAV